MKPIQLNKQVFKRNNVLDAFNLHLFNNSRVLVGRGKERWLICTDSNLNPPYVTMGTSQVWLRGTFGLLNIAIHGAISVGYSSPRLAGIFCFLVLLSQTYTFNMHISLHQK